MAATSVLILFLLHGFTFDDVAPAKGTRSSALTSFPVGERLVYLGHIKKAGVSMRVGRAVFTTTQGKDGSTILSASAKGKKLGYTLDTRITSTVPPDSKYPRLYEFTQRGSETRDKKLVFGKGGAIYWKVKHCRTKNCADPAHQVRKVRWVGPIPWGRRTLHCEGKKCNKPDHRLWRIRERHQYDEPCVDLLTAVYRARNLDLRPGGESVLIPIINDHDRWLVKISAVERGHIEVKAGKFEAVRLVLEPKPTVAGQKKEKFSGLFGMNGAISIWIDVVSHRPILVTGKVPFGFMNLHAKVELEKAERIEARADGSD